MDNGASANGAVFRSKHVERPARLWPWMALCAVAALAIDFGHFHRLQQADSLLPTLTSLLHWTPFHWECNRIGQLTPLLAAPITHPLANLLAQCWAGIFAGLAVMFLLPRHLQRDAVWPWSGLLLAGGFLLLTPENTRFLYLSGYQPYATSMALSLGGAILLEDHALRSRRRTRMFAALALMLLGHWVNPMTALVLVPLTIGRRLFTRDVTAGEWIPTAGALLTAFVASTGASAIVRAFDLYPEDPAVPFGLSRWQLWPEMWRVLAVDSWNSWGAFAPVATIAFAAAIAATRFGAVRGSLARDIPVASAAVVAAVAYMALMGVVSWVHLNLAGGWLYRYWFPGVFVLAAGLAAVCWAPWLRLFVLRIPAGRVVAAVALLGASLVAYGPPSLTTVRADLDASCGGLTADLRAARCTHIVGDYWTAWPAMFHANLIAQERGEPQRIWAVTYRSTALRDCWNAVPIGSMRLAVAADDDDPGRWTTAFELDAMTRERHGAIDVLTPPEVFLVWPDGFFPQETFGGERFRWAKSEAVLHVCNRSETARVVELTMRCRRDDPRQAALSIETPAARDELTVGIADVVWSRTIVAEPGRTEVRFHCNAPRIKAPYEYRALVFRAIEPRLIMVRSAARPRDREARP